LRRLGLPILRRFFEHVVELYDSARLIFAEEAGATKVRANASIDSIVTGLRDGIGNPLLGLFASEEENSEGAVPRQMILIATEPTYRSG
jgi:hypothetical protein